MTAMAVAVAAVAICVTVLALTFPGGAPAPTTAAAPTTTPAHDRPTSRPTATTHATLSTMTPPQPGDQVMDVSPQADVRYLTTLSTAGLLTPGADEQQIIEVGRLVCAYLATSQGDIYDAALLVNQSGQAAGSEAGTIVGAAVGAYCPQYGDQL